LSNEGSISNPFQVWRNTGAGITVFLVLFQFSPMKKHPMPSNPFELVVASFFQSSAMIGVIKSFEQPLKLQFSQLLIIFSS